jgi:hypothetical protein
MYKLLFLVHIYMCTDREDGVHYAVEKPEIWIKITVICVTRRVIYTFTFFSIVIFKVIARGDSRIHSDLGKKVDSHNLTAFSTQRRKSERSAIVT